MSVQFYTYTPVNNMSYRDYLQCEYLRITPAQHKRIREIVGFRNTDYVGPFNSEPIDMAQAVAITEYLVGEVHDDWIVKTFNSHKFETKPLISLSMFTMFLILDYKIGLHEQGKVPPPSFRSNI